MRIKNDHQNQSRSKDNQSSLPAKIGLIILGLGSLFWLIFRSGKKPSRLQYPCQKLAAANSIAFLSWLGAVFGGHLLYRRSKNLVKKLPVLIVIIALVFSGAKTYQVWQKSLRPKTIRGQASSSRVVWITDTGAKVSESYNPSSGNQAAVNTMLDQAIMALTGKASVIEAWTSIFQEHNNGADYSQNEKIAIKVNFNNSYGDGGSNCLSSHCPTVVAINALLRQLIMDKGIPAGNIGVYDTSRSFPNYYNNGVAYGVNLNTEPSCTQTTACTNGGLTARFGCWPITAKYIINMPLLRNHSMAGVTLSLKNHLGSTTEPRCFHGSLTGSTPSSNSLVQLNSQSVIKNKTILVVADALYGMTRGGPDSTPDLRPNSFFLSKDPIAVDSVMMDYLESVGGGFDPDPRGTYTAAAQAGLGNYATTTGNGNCSSFSYPANVINLVCCPNGSCPGTTPQPTSTPTPPVTISPTRTPTPSPTSSCPKGDIDGNCQVNAQDLKLIFSSWLGTGACSGFNCNLNEDNKVNGLDAGIVIANFGK